MPSAGKWMQLEVVILSETDQTQTILLFFLMENLGVRIHLYDIKARGGCLRGGRGTVNEEDQEAVGR